MAKTLAFIILVDHPPCSLGGGTGNRMGFACCALLLRMFDEIAKVLPSGSNRR